MNIENILIIGPSWIGDMMMSHSLYQLIKQQKPFANIDVLATGWTFPLLQRMPEVRESFAMPLTHGQLGLVMRYRIGRKLRDRHYDQAIILPNSWKSALIPWVANIPQRTGWRGEMRYGLINDLRVLDKKKYPLLVEQYLALGLPAKQPLPQPYPYPRLQVIQRQLESTLEKFPFLKERKESRPVLALCPGAQYGLAKNWPAEHFAQVAREKHQEGWDIWLLGASGDMSMGRAIQDQSQGCCINFIGQTTLSDVLDLLAMAACVITNDSGLMHVAAALDIPLIAIYGSSTPQFTPPLSSRAKILSLNLACSPCFQRECPHGHYRCLRELTPSLVLEVMNELKK